MNKSYNRLRHYTIIELLLVVAVLGILMAIGVSGIRRVISGTGVSGGVRGLGNRVTMAKTFAVSSNLKVAVVFPGIVKGIVDTPNLLNKTLEKKYFFRSYRTCVVEWDTSVTPNRYKFIRWSTGGEWSFLSNMTSVIFVGGTPAVVNIDSSKAGYFDADQTDQVNLPAVVFAPSGAIDTNMSTTEIKLMVFEDQYSPDADKFMISGINPSTNYGEQVDKKAWIISINQFVGTLSFERLGMRHD